jgi:hypothetical protein
VYTLELWVHNYYPITRRLRLVLSSARPVTEPFETAAAASVASPAVECGLSETGSFNPRNPDTSICRQCNGLYCRGGGGLTRFCEMGLPLLGGAGSDPAQKAQTKPTAAKYLPAQPPHTADGGERIVRFGARAETSSGERGGDSGGWNHVAPRGGVAELQTLALAVMFICTLESMLCYDDSENVQFIQGDCC